MISRPPTIRIQQSMGECFLLTCFCLNLILLIEVTFSTPTGDYTPSEVAHNPFGINRPQKCAFIPIGGPQAHGDSEPFGYEFPWAFGPPIDMKIWSSL